MGIVFKQSLVNTIITYVGFGIGAINTLFLYTRFLTEEYYGLVGVILSTATILMPILAFGVPNTMVKYYSSFKDSRESDGFLSLMLLLPLLFIIPVAFISYVANAAIGEFLASKNAIVRDYVWYIFLIGMALAYFEVFYAWSKVQLKSVFGNFMKEVFVRLGVTILLILIYFDLIDVTIFLKALVGLFLLRTVVMKVYAYTLKMPGLTFKFPGNTKNILNYSSLIILGGSTAVVLLEIDRFMINQFIQIQNVAYYSVAIFIAAVVAVPSRAMHQITYPMTAELLNAEDWTGLKHLYRKTSLTLFIIAGIIFAGIILNLTDLYTLLPEAYRGGFIVVFLIGLTKVFDAFLGNNNAILYNSEYYRTLLLMGVLLAVITILFNLWLIPVYGLSGAAIASFLAIFMYNCAKLIFVKVKFNILPFTAETFKVLGLLLFIGALFYSLQFPFHPIVNIIIKSILMLVMYVGVLYRLRISEDVFAVLSRYLKR
ncbi:lipopolysaccharide biosynthesis protein [Muriicola sp. Z0-33]|uniref:lipopolysaccharide biosynthesis protein n=1 Tax=Muriicola sp. Z0-33 TaxID=2816957 RepID=UPI002237FE90|nr:oligosaccharide flippase family protein [Muriicola sp. Z0-33]MCW5516638.1 oligosaccharide flippase family protein [Muriicola sp. Z0-33]